VHGGGTSPGAVANAQAGTEFNAGIHETREQIKGSRKRQSNLGDWYRQLARDYQGAQNAGSAALRSIEEATGKQISEAGERSSADQADLAARDAAFAKLIGSAQDPGLSKVAEAGAAARRSQVALNLPIEQQQGNFVGRLGADKAAARLQGIQSQSEERSRREKLKSDLVSQRREKGAARISAKDKILEARAARAAEAKKLALEQQEARASERQAAASQALAEVESARKARSERVGNRQEQEKIQIDRQRAHAYAKHYRRENKGGLTPSERRTRHEHAKNAAVEAANLYKAAQKPPKTNADWAAFAHLVAEQSEISPTEATKAVQKLRAAVAAQARNRNRRMHQGKIRGH
jgi:hypothetical protein